jgi:hypothetical protein
MDETDKCPDDEYTVTDWKWEFLRRNSRYQKAYKATEWLRKRAPRRKTSFRGLGLLQPIYFENLTNRVRERLSLSQPRLKNDSESSDRLFWYLPSPEKAAHEFECSPVRIDPIVDVYTHRDVQGNYTGHSYDEEPLAVTANENQVIALLDTRCKLEDIVSELRVWLSPYVSKQRDQIAKYGDYLAVWDLRQQGKTQDEIARSLWPDEYKLKGGRDPDLSERKGALLQRVHDHENAAQKLIDASFPSKTRQPKKQK